MPARIDTVVVSTQHADSIAIDELYHGKVKILPGKNEEEDLREIAGLAPQQPAEEENAEEVKAETASEESAE